jgi:hypothetical protein
VLVQGLGIGAPVLEGERAFLLPLGADLVVGNALECGIERLDQQGAGEGGQAGFENQAAVLGEPVAHAAVGMLPRLAGELLGVLRAAIAPHQALHVIGGAVQGDHEEGLFGGRAGHAGEGAHFRIAQFTAGHGGGDLGQA